MQRYIIITFLAISFSTGLFSFAFYFKIVDKLMRPSRFVSTRADQRNKSLVRLFISCGVVWTLFQAPSIAWNLARILSRNNFRDCEHCSPVDLICSLKCPIDSEKFLQLVNAVVNGVLTLYGFANCVLLIIMVRPFREYFLAPFKKVRCCKNRNSSSENHVIPA